MENFNRKKHWEDIYENKPLESVSWYQPNPEASLHFIEQANLPKKAKIIDIGGGDSFLVDFLLKAGFEDITILDISNAAIERAKKRLGDEATKVKWIVSDILDFVPDATYDFWHDRATFHFLTVRQEIDRYIKIADQSIAVGGILVVGTFSEQGPKKCSGITIKQYSAQSISDLFQTCFRKIECMTIDHITPFDTKQHFVFCSFRK
ncbi:class I SAM-dependent methyltransferase [Sphingobacterium multivorum]|uniref:Biotin biosynthesis protein BioC n=1 Tax=Sphingobacterium multivorum TaxID=28454 RepID=A0A2X2J298_SPHMU|nr:class I SAM-dependent methyltransferase [Sphingobacterium multivorum]QRQ63624.1 class I SAM-dependent methyltransferase [Sphingobacterium multivorum]SPZ85816.1 biotin biosynthesis protein BioC [Sphingobacterium multivorum]